MHERVGVGAYLRGRRTYPAQLTVTLGNAGRVRLGLDGERPSPPGERGEVVRDVAIPRASTP